MINDLNPSLVVDVGCGRNRFKGRINNLIGFDISDTSKGDFIDDLLNVTYDNVDAVLCEGVLHFDKIEKRFKHILEWVRPGGLIVMRVNIDSGFWSMKKIKTFEKQYCLENPPLYKNINYMISPAINGEGRRVQWIWKTQQ